jgi:drug/metabolite transporter (DMT)-like permease
MVTYLLPPFALVYGALFLGEAIALNALVGLGLVIIGILLANGIILRPAKRRATNPSPPLRAGDERRTTSA